MAIAFDGPISIEILQKFKDSDFVRSRLPISNLTVNTNVKIQGGGKKPETTFKNDGFFLKNAVEAEKALHIRLGSLSLHLLNKYEPLESLINELQEYWAELKKLTKEIKANGISVRYLNLITKKEEEKVEQYVNIFPTHPFSNVKSNNFMNLRFTMNGANIAIVLTEGDIKGEKGILLDNTISKSVSAKDDSFFTSFQELRYLKNYVFFKSITEETVKTYQS